MFNYKPYLKVAISIIAIYYALKCATDGHDFEVFVNAASKLIQNKNIYLPPFAQGLQYYYSPLFALLLTPLTFMPIMAAQTLWIFFSYYCLYRIWILSQTYFDLSKLNKNQLALWLFIVLLFSIRFILIDIGFVQMTSFLLWASLQSLTWIKKGKQIQGAALLALAINIKLLPIGFFIYLIYRKKTRAALFTIIFYLIYLLIPALFVGWDKTIFLTSYWFQTINPLNKGMMIEADNGPSSLVALIPVYITNTAGLLHFKRNFINLNLAQVSFVLNTLRLIFILITLFFLKTRPFKAIKNDSREYWEMSYIFIVTILVFPHQQQYSFLYITPALIYLSYILIAEKGYLKLNQRPWLYVIIALIFFNFSFLINRGIITNAFFELLLYYRALPISLIILIPILYQFMPNNMIEDANLVKE